MLKNEKSANRNEPKNRKTEVFWHKNRKTDLKKCQNRKTENRNIPLLTTSEPLLFESKKPQPRSQGPLSTSRSRERTLGTRLKKPLHLTAPFSAVVLKRIWLRILIVTNK